MCFRPSRRTGLLTVWFALAASAVRAQASDAWEPQRIGEETPCLVATSHPYVGPGEVEAPELVDTERFEHPGATYIAVHFKRFELAAGDRLVVRSPDGKQVWTYEGLGRGELGHSPGGFWATHIKGEAAIVELYSRHAVGAWGYETDKFAWGIPAAAAALSALEPGGGEPPLAPQEVCNADDSQWAPCYKESEPQIYDHSRAVARLLINGTLKCTGWLLGCQGHIMTANHCIDTQSDASNTDYEFMAEGATCQTTCFNFGCPGQIVATTGTLVKTAFGLDYALVKMTTNAIQTIDKFGYLQFRETGGPVLNERIYIPGHPAAWGKRIAVESDASNDQSGFCEIFSTQATPCHAGGVLDAAYFCDTQDGSSGSPVLAYSDQRVVALHHCGPCANRAVRSQDLIAALQAAPAVLPACSLKTTLGVITLDADSYSCNATVIVTLEDQSLVGSPSVQLTARSNTETTFEGVTLLATATPGVFQGSFSLTPGPVVQGDGVVSVVDGDLVTVRYIDQDNGAGAVVTRTKTATTVCVGVPPVPDGTGGSQPLTASRLTVTGDAVEVEWHNECPVGGSAILYGPLAGVASYGISGAVCAIPGGASSVQWNAVPPGDLWFLMVNTDGAETESSWGQSSAGERNGSTPSGQCGALFKDLTGTCP